MKRKKKKFNEIFKKIIDGIVFKYVKTKILYLLSVLLKGEKPIDKKVKKAIKKEIRELEFERRQLEKEIDEAENGNENNKNDDELKRLYRDMWAKADKIADLKYDTNNKEKNSARRYFWRAISTVYLILFFLETLTFTFPSLWNQ